MISINENFGAQSAAQKAFPKAWYQQDAGIVSGEEKVGEGEIVRKHMTNRNPVFTAVLRLTSIDLKNGKKKSGPQNLRRTGAEEQRVPLKNTGIPPCVFKDCDLFLNLQLIYVIRLFNPATVRQYAETH